MAKFRSFFRISAIYCSAFFSVVSYASDFSIPFVSISGLGNAYSGWAAEAFDASTTTTNPAGLVLLPDAEIMFSALEVMGHTEFHGTATDLISSKTGSATGLAGGFAPLFYLSIPLSDRFTFGFGANAPFGLGTNYPKDSLARYAATRSEIVDIDFSPSLGIKLNNKLSVGFGADIQQLKVTLNHMYGIPPSVPDSEAQNHLRGWGYGYHAGILYQMVPCTRVGLSFNSQTMFHLGGYSDIFPFRENRLRTDDIRVNTPLPARAQASNYHELTKKLTVLGSVFYDRWSTLNTIVLQNTMLPNGRTTPVTIPLQYHDTFDYALGFNLQANKKIILRTGVQYFNTPSNDRDRSVADPVGKMLLLGFGAHYQHNSWVSYDLGYAHDFFQKTVINFVTPVNTLKGHSTMGTNIFGIQATWNI